MTSLEDRVRRLEELCAGDARGDSIMAEFEQLQGDFYRALYATPQGRQIGELVQQLDQAHLLPHLLGDGGVESQDAAQTVEARAPELLEALDGCRSQNFELPRLDRIDARQFASVYHEVSRVIHEFEETTIRSAAASRQYLELIKDSNADDGI